MEARYQGFWKESITVLPQGFLISRTVAQVEKHWIRQQYRFILWLFILLVLAENVFVYKL